MNEAIRIGFMAGRGISTAEIAKQFDVSPAMVRNALKLAGITPPVEQGPTVHLIVPIASFIPEIDAVGQRRKMSREEIACEILRVVFADGEAGIETVIERGQHE